MRALVLGLGRFGGGIGAARFLAGQGHAVRIADKADATALADSVRALAGVDLEWCLQREDAALLDGVDTLVVNPAIPDQHPLLAAARARGLPVTQEVELLLAHYPGRVVLVTGTNGKSTTSNLIFQALRAAGRDVLLGGNIGRSLLDASSEWRPAQVAVVEISSFQLDRIDPQRLPCAEGAVAVRITSDHLDRHGTLQAYHRAKSVVARAARDFLVHADDDPVAAGFATSAPRRLTYGLRAPASGQVGVVGRTLVSALERDPGVILDRAALRLLGDYNVENALAAFVAARELGVSRHHAALGIATAAPLPYRLQLAGRLGNGTRVYDNAVSTDADSTAAALHTLAAIERGRVLWVGGGKSKDGDFARAADRLAPHLTAAFLFGAAAAPLAQALAGRALVEVGVTLEDALGAACAAAGPTDAILFSPAFASFDQYPNFRARAEHFWRWFRAAACAPIG